MKRLIIIALVANLAACGGIKVGVDDETRSAIEDIFGGSETETEASEEPGAEDTDVLVGEEYSDGETGLIVRRGNNRNDRKFLGTFDQNHVYDTCPSWPSIVRLYSKDDTVFIDDNRGDLISSAKIFDDGTFDFDAEYADEFGRPSVDLICTCDLDESDYYGTQMDCSCDLGDDDTCEILYDKID
jgi:hypothetical protein